MAERVDLDGLERLARLATPGPWISEPEGRDRYGVRVGSADHKRWVAYTGEEDDGEADPDAQYIAAADPATVLALVAELRVAREFRDDIAAALAPGRWRGFDGPNGVSTHEVIDDVAAALKRYDQAGST